jgi:hypothetical protein
MILVQGDAFIRKASLLATKKLSPVVLTTGPEEILCSGRVGSRAPIRGGLPLLGPAAGSVGLSETHVSDESFPAWDWL